jgi:hypothetical protein
MRKFMLVIAMFTLLLATGAFAESKPMAKPAGTTPQDKVAVTITNKRGKPIKLESLSQDDQGRVNRAREAAENLLKSESGRGGAQRIKVRVSGSCCPVTITITIEF